MAPKWQYRLLQHSTRAKIEQAINEAAAEDYEVDKLAAHDKGIVCLLRREWREGAVAETTSSEDDE
jgi:hypothetical protein